MGESLTFRTVVKFMIFSIGAILILLYLIFQARFLIIGPRVILTEEHDVPQNERQIFLTGNAYNISRLWLNDRPIYTNAQGNFKEALVLENGYTIATLRAEDRYGRETTITRSFVYAPVSFIR
jgi:hypothetical protein